MTKREHSVVPCDYLFQATAISRAAYTMSVMERRLVYLAMVAVRPQDDVLPDVYLRVSDVIKALGLPDKGETYDTLRSACESVRTRAISIDTPTGWKVFGWINSAEYYEDTGKLRLKLHDDLTPYVLHLKKAFSVLTIHDVAKLQSRYALRLWEIVLSYRGFEGEASNGAGEWFVDLLFADLRHMMKIDSRRYRQTKDLRINIVDLPIREINEAGLGLHIIADYQTHRHGRRLDGVRLRCRSVKAGDPRPVNPATQADWDALSVDERIETLPAAARKIFDRALADELRQHDLFEAPSGPVAISAQVREEAARRIALAEAEKVFTPSQTPAPRRPRGRPRKAP